MRRDRPQPERTQAQRTRGAARVDAGYSRARVKCRMGDTPTDGCAVCAGGNAAGKVAPSSTTPQARAVRTTSANSHAPNAKPVTALVRRAFGLDKKTLALHDAYSNPELGAGTLIQVKRPAAEPAGRTLDQMQR